MSKRLIVWKDRGSCEKYYKTKDYLGTNEIDHQVKLAMEFGCLIRIDQNDLESFRADYNVRVY